MNANQALAIGILLIGIFFVASALVAILGALAELATLIVGAGLLGAGVYLLKQRSG
jgi:hypothetical protein